MIQKIESQIKEQKTSALSRECYIPSKSNIEDNKQKSWFRFQAADRREMAVGVMQRLEDLNTVLGQTNDHRHRVLVAAAKNIKVWFIKVRKIKAIYHTLNFFNLDVTQKCLIAECWIPTVDVEAIQVISLNYKG